MRYILLIVGFLLIIKASDVLVEAAKSIAIKLKIPKILLSLTVVAIGTCVPELAISINSVSTGNGSIALANVVGSNIINILLVIGISSLINPIKIKSTMLKKELPLLLLVTIMFTIVTINGIMSPNKLNFFGRDDGLILVVLIIFFINYIIGVAKRRDPKEKNEKPKYGFITGWIYLIAMLGIIFFAADMIVNNAIIIAEQLGISQKVITMFVIVIGTSLPELFLTISMAKKKEHEMAIGNIVGTNICNICIILGMPVLIFGGFEIVDFHLIDIGVLLISAYMLYVFAKSERSISKNEGILMLSIFILYYGYILFGY